LFGASAPLSIDLQTAKRRRSMLYMLMGYLHAAIEGRVRAIRSLAGERGQGTVEYVGLILLVSLLMVGMVAAMKGFNRYLSKGGNYQPKSMERRSAPA
jgi:hypothetical protein